MTKAFTLIELLIVTIIIGVLAAIAFPNYQSVRQQLALQRATNKLAQDIRRAQEMAMSAQEWCSTYLDYKYEYGVILYNNAQGKYRYHLFADCDNDGIYAGNGTDEEVETIYFIEKGVESDLSSTYPSIIWLSIIFTPPDPSVTADKNPVPSPSFPVTITLTNNGQSKTITVNEVGLIDY